MGFMKSKLMEMEEKNQKWYTTTCTHCKQKFPVTKEDYIKEKDGDDPNWCLECKERLFS